VWVWSLSIISLRSVVFLCTVVGVPGVIFCTTVVYFSVRHSGMNLERCGHGPGLIFPSPVLYYWYAFGGKYSYFIFTFFYIVVEPAMRRRFNFLSTLEIIKSFEELRDSIIT